METIIERTYRCKECLVPVKVDMSMTVCEESRVIAALVHVDKNLHLLEIKILKVVIWFLPTALATKISLHWLDRIPPIIASVCSWR
jgi:hypothetical protein